MVCFYLFEVVIVLGFFICFKFIWFCWLGILLLFNMICFGVFMFFYFYCWCGDILFFLYVFGDILVLGILDLDGVGLYVLVDWEGEGLIYGCWGLNELGLELFMRLRLVLVWVMFVIWWLVLFKELLRLGKMGEREENMVFSIWYLLFVVVLVVVE